MNEQHLSLKEHDKQAGFDWYKVGLWGAIGIIGYFLVTEHRAHMFSFLPFVLLLACPFMPEAWHVC
jgi:hypothetical protein